MGQKGSLGEGGHGDGTHSCAQIPCRMQQVLQTTHRVEKAPHPPPAHQTHSVPIPPSHLIQDASTEHRIEPHIPPSPICGHVGIQAVQGIPFRPALT